MHAAVQEEEDQSVVQHLLVITETRAIFWLKADTRVYVEIEPDSTDSQTLHACCLPLLAMNAVQVSPAPILDLINAFRSSQALFSAVSLGVVDALAVAQAAGPADANAVCQALAAQGKAVSADGVARLLRACAALGLLVQHAGVEHEPSAQPAGDGAAAVQSRSAAPAAVRYSLGAEAQAYLTADSPLSLAGYIMHSVGACIPPA